MRQAITFAKEPVYPVLPPAGSRQSRLAPAATLRPGTRHADKSDDEGRGDPADRPARGLVDRGPSTRAVLNVVVGHSRGRGLPLQSRRYAGR